MGRGAVCIGTSGWNYGHWRAGAFYPKGLPQHAELAYIAHRFASVEVNGTFYSLTRPTACEAWRLAVPPSFRFALKGSRYITHMLKLANFDAPLANFFASGILRLGRHLGPFLWQLPPMLRFMPERVERFLEALPRTVPEAERWARRHDARTTGRCALTAPDGRTALLRHAIEPRHESWRSDEALALLERYGIALVTADTPQKHPFLLETTADFHYVRLHGSEILYASRYTDAELARWAALLRGWRAAGRDVYVYFDNDSAAHAPHDALRLRALVEGPGALSGAPIPEPRSPAP